MLLVKIVLLCYVVFVLSDEAITRIKRRRQLRDMHLFRRLTDTGYATECGLEGKWTQPGESIRKKQPKARHYRTEVTCKHCLTGEYNV